MNENNVTFLHQQLKLKYANLVLNQMHDITQIQLSLAAAKLYEIFVLLQLGHDNNIVSYKFGEDIFGITLSHPTYYKAINELLDLEIVTRYKNESFTFVLNPEYFPQGEQFTLTFREMY